MSQSVVEMTKDLVLAQIQTGSIFPEDVHDAIASGCDGYVAKPFKPTELRALVQDFLG